MQDKHKPKGADTTEVKLGVGLVMSSQAMLVLCCLAFAGLWENQEIK